MLMVAYRISATHYITCSPRAFVNHLSEAKGEQDRKADEAQESFGEFVIASGDSPVALDSLEEVLCSMTTLIDFCGKAAQS
jgi:hypothetical protein